MPHWPRRRADSSGAERLLLSMECEWVSPRGTRWMQHHRFPEFEEAAILWAGREGKTRAWAPGVALCTSAPRCLLALALL